MTVDATTLGRLARTCYRKRRQVLATWVLGLIVITGLGFAVGGGIFQDKFGGGSSESQRAQNLLQQRFPQRAGDTADVVVHTSTPVSDPANMAAIQQVNQTVAAVPHVVAVLSPFAQGGQGQISSDGSIAYSIIQFDKTTQDLPKKDMKQLVSIAKTASKPGFEVEMGGQPIEKAEAPPFGTSEIVGIWAAIIILLIAFGSVIAMGLPIMTALFGIGFAAGVIDIVSHVVVVPTFGTELAAMIGLGVGIDYALFIVTRYRQGLHEQGMEPEESVIAAIGTSGRAVLFAGCTVIISLLGMLLLGLQFIYGLAIGAISAVVLVMAGALTLLPAVLGFCGRAIDNLALPKLLHKGIGEKKTMAYRWSRFIQKRKLIAAASSFIVLVVLALPLFGMHLAFTDAGNDPASFTTKKAYDLLAQGFGPGTNGPLVLAVSLTGPGDQATLTKLTSALQADPDIGFVVPATINPAGDTAVIIAIPKTSPQDPATQTLVHRMRDTIVPTALAGTGVKALVGGVTAAAVDSSAQISSRLLVVIGGVVLLSFLLLMAVFRSVAVPLKAAVMNLLSVGAAYGVIVAVFQWGWGGSFFNIGKTGPIDPWIPLMLFTILFGLSMDYEVFLLSRIREEYLKTGDNATSVADGLAVTARVITAAALIMVCVFGSFVLGELRILKVFGLGLATAVLVDATLVRMILVPATMELLGPANWWFPKWLDKAVPNISVETLPAPEPALAGSPK